MATQSLYRRYRPRRFSELKGQDHVVHALRDAVAAGREGQAYLFSGPRGTGKTTSARILAKVLNCENVVDGEPCCECDSCLAVERGTSYDVHELDAASNNGVDAIRDLVEKAALGTPGRHKVYILDEVHMLSKAAEAALLKTLEEPPPHVVFVLATTDPQKMSDTIRSRTQHLQFHLLPADTLAEHVRWVARDAGYELSDLALDKALIQGGGSARDTLSALELIASTGGDVDDVLDLDEFLQALIDHDPGRVLTAMGHAVSMGRDPRTVTEDLVRHLRNAFLSLMAPELVVLPSDRLDALAAQSQQLGAAALVRAIERLGGILVEMRHAPDPRILVEVALVQLTHDESSDDAEVLTARLERLEQTVKQLRETGPAPSAPRDPSTGRAVLGGAAHRPATGRRSTAPDTPDTPGAAAAAPGAATPAPPAAAAGPVATDATDATGATGDTADAAPDQVAPATPSPAVSVVDAWEQTVKAKVKPLVRALYSAGSFVGNDDGRWQFGVPNEAHGAKCAEHRADVEAALAAVVGEPVSIEFVVGGAPTASGSSGSSGPSGSSGSSSSDADGPGAPGAGGGSRSESRAGSPGAAAPSVAADGATGSESEADPDDEIDLNELTDAPPESVKTPIDRLAEAFPGSELVADD